MVEFQETLAQKLMNLLEQGIPEQMKEALCQLIVQILKHQYDTDRQRSLINAIKADLGKAKSFVMRRAYITFCTEAIKELSWELFKMEFLGLYLTLGNDRITHVKIHFLNSIPKMKPWLSHDVDTVLEINSCLNILRCESNTIAEITDTVEMTLLKNKNLEYYKDGEEKRRKAYRIKLEKRFQMEEEERKKRLEEEEDVGHDYLRLLTESTRKYGTLKRGGGGAFKFSFNRKPATSQNFKNHLSPPTQKLSNLDTKVGSIPKKRMSGNPQSASALPPIKTSSKDMASSSWKSKKGDIQSAGMSPDLRNKQRGGLLTADKKQGMIPSEVQNILKRN